MWTPYIDSIPHDAFVFKKRARAGTGIHFAHSATGNYQLGYIYMISIGSNAVKLLAETERDITGTRQKSMRQRRRAGIRESTERAVMRTYR